MAATSDSPAGNELCHRKNGTNFEVVEDSKTMKVEKCDRIMPESTSGAETTFANCGGRSEGKVANGGGESEGKVANGGGESEGKVANGGGESEGKVANGGGESEGKVDNGGGESEGTVVNGGGESEGKVANGGGESEGTVANGGGESEGKVANGGEGEVVNGGGESEGKVANGGGESEDKVANGGGGSDEGGGGGGDFESAIKYAYRPSSPAHRGVKESPLSSDAIFQQSHAGLFNLCVVVLVAVNSRLIIENLMKYGLLIRAGFWFSSKSLRDWPLFMCCLSLPLFPLTAFLVEKMTQRRCISDPVVVLLHAIISTTVILYPVFVILRFDSAVLSGVTLMLFACTMWLKLISYAHTNYDMRAIAKASLKDDDCGSELPYDVNIQSLVYFMVAPTLCYQPSYPRNATIRKRWVARQFVKLIVFTGVMGFIVEQYINPIVKNSQHPLKGNLLYAIERILKLSVPNLYVWLCMFYCFFHLWLNILAELLRFGDREFYKDWWNARSFEEYWRMWNMPVHKWMVRHIYFPCLRNGIPKGVAVVISFLISAIFHELCIAVPCHIFKLWAFLGIMFQVPLVLLTNLLQRKFQNSMVGNMIFWFIFSVFGQPMCVLLYYHDLMNRKVRLS